MVSLEVNTYILHDIRLIIFDKDGTLMDLYNYWSNMVAYRVELAQKKLSFDEKSRNSIMYAMGVDTAKGKLRKEGPVGLKKREIVMQAMIDALEKIGFNDTHDLCFEIFREVDRKSIEYFPYIVKPINGMYQLVDNLKKYNCKIAIATTDKTERAQLAVNFLGIADKVDTVIGEDSVAQCKPSPDMVNLILKELSVNREDTVTVGDAITDIEMGINAGVKASIGVCSGLTPKEMLLEKTQYVIEDISKIIVLNG